MCIDWFETDIKINFFLLGSILILFGCIWEIQVKKLFGAHELTI